MPALTAPQLALLRADGHKTQWYLKVCVPQTLFSARVNDASIARGAVDITFDNGVGVSTDALEGMSVWIGSATGLHDLGVTRLRRDTIAAQLLVAENSEILWADNLYLTVKNEFLPWPKYPRLVAPSSYYKDYDYINIYQTDQWPPVAIMGAPAVGILSAGSATIAFDGSDSYAIYPSATIAVYAWEFPSGAPATSAAATQSVVWSVAGVYWVRFQAEDSNARGSFTRRPILITDLSDCLTDFVCESMSGDIDNGWQATFRVSEAATLAELPDGAPVFFFGVDYYGTTQTAIGMTGTRDNLKLFGYVLKDTVRKDPETGDTLFEVGTVNQLLSKVGTPFPKYLEDVGSVSPTIWTEGYRVTVQRALFYLIKFHSTLTEVTDMFIEQDDTSIAESDFPDAPLWDQLKTFAASTRLMRCSVSKQGVVRIKRDVNTIPIADRAAIPTVALLTHGDWDGEISIVERTFSEVSQIDLSGLRYTGIPPVSDSSIFPVFSLAPGRAPLAFGNRNELRSLALNSQSEANQLAGDVLARDNNRYESLTFPFNGNWVCSIEPAEQEYFTLSLAAGDTNRGIVWTAQKLIARQVTIDFDWAAGYMRPVVTFEIDTGGGTVGIDGDYPTTAPITQPVTPPVITPPAVGGYADTWRGHVLYAGRNGRVYESFDFSGPTGAMPTWADISDGLVLDVTNSIWMMIGDPYHPETYQYLIQQVVGAYVSFGTNSRIYRRSNGGSWSQIADGTTLTALNFSHLETIFGDINQEGWLGCFLTAGAAANTNIQFTYSTDRGDTWSAPVNVDNNSPFGNATIRQFAIIGAFQGNSGSAAGDIIYCACSRGTAAGVLKISTDKGANWVTQSTPAPFQEGYSSVYVDPNNQDVIYLYGVDAEGVGLGDGIRVSTDQGTTFSTLQLSGEGNQALQAINIRYQVEAAGASEWVYFGGAAGNPTKLYRTIDGGSNYTSNAGTGLPTPTNGYPLQVSTVHDSPGKYYGWSYGEVDAGQPVIFVSEDYGATWTDKSGTAPDNIPTTAGGGAGLLQDWLSGGV